MKLPFLFLMTLMLLATVIFVRLSGVALEKLKVFVHRKLGSGR